MTTDEIKTTVKRHRHAAIGGGIAGLALLVAYIGYGVAMTPARPDLNTAEVETVIDYIADERGLDRLPQIEQQQFLDRWGDLVMKDPKKKEELTQCCIDLEDQARKAFSDAMFRHFKRTFLDEAARYAQLPKDEKYDFLRKKLVEGREKALFLKDVAVGFKKQFSGRQDDLQKWIIEHTTPEERALGEPYLDALKRVRQQTKKEQSAPAAAPPDTPGP